MGGGERRVFKVKRMKTSWYKNTGGNAPWNSWSVGYAKGTGKGWDHRRPLILSSKVCTSFLSAQSKCGADFYTWAHRKRNKGASQALRWVGQYPTGNILLTSFPKAALGTGQSGIASQEQFRTSSWEGQGQPQATFSQPQADCPSSFQTINFPLLLWLKELKLSECFCCEDS